MTVAMSCEGGQKLSIGWNDVDFPDTSASCPRAMTLRPPSHIINTKIQFRNLQVVRSNLRKRYYLEVAMMCEGGRRWKGVMSHTSRAALKKPHLDECSISVVQPVT